MTAIQVLGLMEVGQVLVVSKDLDGEGRAVEVVSSRLQSTDDSEEFPVVDVIIVFCKDE